MIATDDTRIAADLVAQVEPVLRKYAAQAEAERRLAPEAVAALVEPGMFRTWVPKAYGGLEMDPIPAIKMFQEISRVDSAAGWVVSQCCIIAYLAAMVSPPEANEEMFGDPRGVFAGAWFPPGKAEPVEDGYRVSGQWSFGSGCNYATWLQGRVQVHDSGTPRVDPGGNPVELIVNFPGRDAEILDTWNTLGMRGTGSHDFRINDLFIPERRCWQIVPFAPPDQASAGPLYRHGAWINAPMQSCVALGVARAALEDFIVLARTKTPSYLQTGLADRSLVQDRVARARALIDAGWSYIETALARAGEFVSTGAKIDMEHGTAVGLSGCFAHDAACQAVDLIHACAGTTAIRSENRFQQYFRDVHTLSQHAFTGPARFESLGKLLLGRESDWPFHYL